MVDKVNGKAMPDQHLTGSLQYVAIDAGSALPLNVQANLDRLVETVSQRSQPVILGKPSGNAINIAFGHEDVWGQAVVGASLALLVDALVKAGFTGATAVVKEF